MNTLTNKLFYLIILSFISTSYGFAFDTSEKRTINLSSFGAIPNDNIDDSKAFKEALEDCRKNPGTTLFIEPGDYNFRDEQALTYEYKAINGQYGENVQGHFFKPGGEYVIALDFNNFKDITIQAEGVTLVQEGWYEAISITNAENVSIYGLTLIHKRPPFTTGKITVSTPEYFEMKIDVDKYPFITDKVTGRVHFHDVEKQRIYTGRGIEKKELVDNETIRIYTKTQPKLNDLCILRHSAHNRAGILIKESTNIHIENVKIHSHPGMGIVGHRSENIVMRNLQVIPAPGTVTSTNTDATHFTSCKGKILFDACKFGGQGDDCTNVHNYYWGVYKESDNKVRVTVENADLHALSLDYPDVGDTLALVTKDKLTPIQYFITKDVKTSVEKWEVIITLDKPFKHNSEDFYMINLTRRPAVEIVNNTVRSHMARAYLIKSRNVKIHGNVIQNSSGSAIQLGAEASWRESGPVENVLIENNWIIGCGYGHGRQKGSAISAEVNGVKGKSDQLNKNIIIRNNVIEAEGISAIYVSGTEGVEITDNKVSGSEEAVLVENSKSIKVENNGSLPIRIND